MVVPGWWLQTIFIPSLLYCASKKNILIKKTYCMHYIRKNTQDNWSQTSWWVRARFVTPSEHDVFLYIFQVLCTKNLDFRSVTLKLHQLFYFSLFPPWKITICIRENPILCSFDAESPTGCPWIQTNKPRRLLFQTSFNPGTHSYHDKKGAG